MLTDFIDACHDIMMVKKETGVRMEKQAIRYLRRGDEELMKWFDRKVCESFVRRDCCQKEAVNILYELTKLEGNLMNIRFLG